jgi:hypothetical protein
VKETERETLKEEIRRYMQENLRATPDIELVPPGSIQVEKGGTGKVKMIEILKKT